MTVLEQILRVKLPLPAEFLQEAVRRIVQVADPEKIIVFGSAARGQLAPESDVDFLVVKVGDYHPRRVTTQFCRALADLERDIDIVVVTSAQLDRYKDSPWLVLYNATREGNLL